jgi:hypothetical protein
MPAMRGFEARLGTDPTTGQAKSQTRTSTPGCGGAEHWRASEEKTRDGALRENKKTNESAAARLYEKTGARTEKEIEELD